MVTSVHVLFDESIPERGVLDKAIVKVDPRERRVEEFNLLVGQHLWSMFFK